ncbi:hypothetical protein SAMN05428989_2086 [Pseudoxanthomonas sp. GM95]|uniref:hypothetical protein n=1 Tax=Pseudoxanthomonas sp. GM95 TaxID=1881043 RepID=UPI0008ACC67E|nr:hypothetical protein [Pseudoxanthomonas sp. GM95]SEL62296.1 hypothetical protein SAMN05428989_2086 [Pseudoxanthomonas sp. GM95]
MPNRDTNQAADMAFSATVASALARSIRDTPLRPLPAQAEALLASAEIVVAAPADDAKETV